MSVKIISADINTHHMYVYKRSNKKNAQSNASFATPNSPKTIINGIRTFSVLGGRMFSVLFLYDVHAWKILLSPFTLVECVRSSNNVLV